MGPLERDTRPGILLRSQGGKFLHSTPSTSDLQSGGLPSIPANRP
jgi:hypothetical protein